ncbi:hypothetical protein OAV62_00305 [bacterium]|nr:hypothetical protein [bacterium]
MKASKSTVIPVEPGTQEELEAVLQSGESAKVKLEGSDTVFMMKKADKGDEYELSQVASTSSGDDMRKALEGIKALIK